MLLRKKHDLIDIFRSDREDIEESFGEFSKADRIQMENVILSTLDFQILTPQSLWFLLRLLEFGRTPFEAQMIARYIHELVIAQKPLNVTER